MVDAFCPGSGGSAPQGLRSMELGAGSGVQSQGLGSGTAISPLAQSLLSPSPPPPPGSAPGSRPSSFTGAMGSSSPQGPQEYGSFDPFRLGQLDVLAESSSEMRQESSHQFDLPSMKHYLSQPAPQAESDLAPEMDEMWQAGGERPGGAGPATAENSRPKRSVSRQIMFGDGDAGSGSGAGGFSGSGAPAVDSRAPGGAASQGAGVALAAVADPFDRFVFQPLNGGGMSGSAGAGGGAGGGCAGGGVNRGRRKGTASPSAGNSSSGAMATGAPSTWVSGAGMAT